MSVHTFGAPRPARPALAHAGAVLGTMSAVGAALLAVGFLAPATPAPGAGSPPYAAVAYAAPVAPFRVVRAFEPPATKYGAGHLGVDLATRPGTPVGSAGAGVVRFAGAVAGRGVVVVQHADGVATEYEPLRVSVATGAVVGRGTVLGVVAGVHGTCAPGRCLHWGARRAASYLDPLLLLRPLGPVRLLPWSG